MNEEIKFYSIDEVASMIHVTRRAMYNYLKNGKLKATKFGKYWRVSEQDLKEFLSNGVKYDN